MKRVVALFALVACSSGAHNPSPKLDPGPDPTSTVGPVETAKPTPTETPTDPVKAPAGSDVARSNDFAARLFKGVAKGKDTNTTLSPTSVRLAMSLVAQGAKGATKTELATALNLHATDSAADAASELAEWKKRGTEGTTLRIANRLFSEKTTPANAPFQDVATKQFGSTVEALDFKGSAEPSRALMNKWVAKETENKISDLFPQGSITGDTRFVIANAVYFLGTWKSPFDAKATTPKPFFVGGGSTSKPAPMMQKTARFAFAEEEDVLLASLPYEGDKMAMVVALPKAKNGLGALVERLDGAVLGTWHDALGQGSRELALELPKFELSAGGSIKPNLAALGAKLAFSDAADFTGVSRDGKLSISDVFHKTYIRVDEKGTEAAAATGVVVGTTSMPPPPTPFVADHPFVYYLVDKTNGRVLFIGAIVDPTAKK